MSRSVRLDTLSTWEILQHPRKHGKRFTTVIGRIRSGELYDFVEHVNAELMAAEQAANCTPQRNPELPNETTLPNETRE